MAIEKNVKQSTMSLTCSDPRQSPIEECRTLSSSSSYPQQSFKVCKEERPFVCKIQKDSYLKLKEFEDNDKPFITNLIEESNSPVIANGFSSTSPKNLTTLEAQQVLQYTKQALEKVNGSLAPSDLLTLVQFLSYVSDMDFDENETMETVDGLGQSFIEVAGEIFEEKHVHRWMEISQVVSGPMTVVQSIDRMAANLNTLLMTKQGEVVLQGKNIKLQFTQRILNENTSSCDFHGPNSTQESTVDYISVPSEQLEELKRKGNQKVTFINTWYGSLHPFFVNGSGTRNDSLVSDGSQRLIGTILGSSVISTTAYSDIQKTNLAVHYRLQHKIETIPGIELKPSCTFWNYSLRPDEGGSWSTEGCFVTSTGPNSTSCFCNHTTNFAVLLQIYELQTTPAEDSMLRLLTFIGCGVSLFSLILTFILFIAVGVPTSDRTTVHKNLIVALATAEILLMFSDLASKNKEACIAVTALLHLFFMASFTWMLVEGLLLWSKVVSVNISEDRRMKFYYVIGWGLPVIIVGITLATSFNKYVADNYCWLNVQTDIIWSFVGPVLFVLFVNTIVLFRVVVVTVASARRRSKMMTPSCSSKSQKLELTWAATKPVLILLPVLGLTWLCGIFVNFTVVLAYIFIAMNAFQGLYIFLVYAVYNSEVRNAIQRMKEKKKALSFTNCSQPASFLSSPRNTDTSYHQKKSLPSLENSVSSIVQNGSMDKSLFYKNNGFRKESFVNFSVKPASKNQVDKTG
ncbi:adhesion G-protein coupled receptor D2 [Erpetoichthys calabaricus]|uniref:adhesion G-protein coupled receptor D2 n=1 Tax=Erpetoichthys calabaricus TaxID=27687 RepID=UPI0022341CCC|nr:adhesion G-protein coupled receptor D2 [Erpetoichthys calabaricus]